MGRRSQILSSAGLVSGLTAASKVLGVVRDSLIAARLGGTSYNDVFQIASTIPNLARRVLGEGALSAFIVPIISHVRREEGPQAAWRSTSNAFNLFALLTLVLTIVGLMFAKPLFVFYGGSKYALADRADQLYWLNLGVSLTRIMFPYLMILTLVALLMGVCHSLNHFAAPALGSALINMVMIAGALIFFGLAEQRFLYVQAWAMMIGAGLRLLILFPPLIRRGYRWQPVAEPREPAFVELTSKMPAAVYAMAVAQINIAVSFSLAGWCGAGSITALRYSQTLIMLPQALFATALSTVLLPQLSVVVAEKNHEELRDVMGFAFRGILLVFVPATIGLIVLGRPIVQVLYQRGEWTPAATAATASALFYYAVGLVALGVQRVFLPLYYAQKDVKTPVKYAAISMVISVVLGAMFVAPMFVPGWAEALSGARVLHTWLMWPLSFSGLALASSLAAILNTWLMWRGLVRRYGRDFAGPMWPTLLRSLGCAALMGVVCGVGFYTTEKWLQPGTILRFALTLGWIGVGLLVYAAAAWVAGLWDRKLLSMMLKQA